MEGPTIEVPDSDLESAVRDAWIAFNTAAMVWLEEQFNRYLEGGPSPFGREWPPEVAQLKTAARLLQDRLDARRAREHNALQ